MTPPREPDARKIDAECAVKVMGWKRPKSRRCATWTHPDGYGASESSIPHYSSNIADAMAVLEKMRERGWGVRMLTSDGWQVLLSMPHGHHNVGHESLPMAICLAALRAVGAERKDCGVQQKEHTDHKEKNE